MNITLQHSKVTHSADALTVELFYGDRPLTDADQSGVLIRLPVEWDESPLLPIAQRAALVRVRELIRAEIQRLDNTRGHSR